MQEEVTRGAVTLIVDGAKLSKQVFEKAVKKFLEEIQKNQKSKNARKIRKTEDVQTPSVSSFGFSIFKAPSMAPSTIGKYCSGQSFNFCPTRWRSSLSSRMTSGLKYLSIGRPQIFTSCMMTGRWGSCPRFQCWQDTWYQCSPFRLNLFVQGSSPSVLLLHPHRSFQIQGSL